MGVNGIYGLSGSGLDIESMVKVGMMSKQNQYDKMQQTYTKNEWTKEAYLEIYDKIQDYSLNTLSNYKLSSYMNPRTATSSNPIIKATADSSAPARNHTITVESTATSAYLVGTKSLERGIGNTTDNSAGDNKNPKSTKLSDSLFQSWSSKEENGSTTYTFTLWDKDRDGNYNTFSTSDLSRNAMSFTLSDGNGTGVRSSDESVVTVTTKDGYNISSETKYTVEITKAAQSATATFSNTALSSDTNPQELIASALGWDSLDGVSIANGKVTFSGTQTNSSNGQTTGGLESQTETTGSVSKSFDSNTTALSFTFGTSNTDTGTNVTITYGEIAKRLVDGDVSFDDFVELLNQKLDESNVDVTASYDSDTGAFSFTNKKASKDDIVGVYLDATGLGNGILQTLYDKATDKGNFYTVDDSAYALVLSDTNGSVAQGTIKKGDNYILSSTDNTGKVIAASFNADGTFTDTDAGIVFTAGNVGTTTVTANPEKTINVTYQQIIDGFSYYDLVSKINNQGTNVKANYDAMQDKFSIYNMKTGTSNNVTLTMNKTDDGNKLAETFFDGLGLKDYAESDDLTNAKLIDFESGKPKTFIGGNAAVWVDHQKYENIDSNSLKVQGVTYNFANVTEKTTATVTVEQDVDTIIKNVKGFIDSYNELLNDLYTKYRETPNSSYAPLTEAQKNEMTEEQIKKWEEKAKSGLLYHDSTVRRIIDQMRSAVSNSINSLGDDYKYDNAYSIGISTKGLYGQLTLDEDKLKDALNDDPDSVYKVFATLDSTKSDAANGIAQRLGDIMTSATKSISNVAGTSSDISDDSRLSTLLRNLQTRMSNFQTMMNAFENQLYKKYDAMESALAMLGSQLNYVTSAFSG